MLQWTRFYKSLCADKQVCLQREQEELPGRKACAFKILISVSELLSWAEVPGRTSTSLVRVLTQILTDTWCYKTWTILPIAW